MFRNTVIIVIVGNAESTVILCKKSSDFNVTMTSLSSEQETISCPVGENSDQFTLAE